MQFMLIFSKYQLTATRDNKFKKTVHYNLQYKDRYLKRTPFLKSLTINKLNQDSVPKACPQNSVKFGLSHKK